MKNIIWLSPSLAAGAIAVSRIRWWLDLKSPTARGATFHKLADYRAASGLTARRWRRADFSCERNHSEGLSELLT